MTEYFYFYSPFWVNKFVELLISFDVSLIFILIYFNNIYLLLTKLPSTEKSMFFHTHTWTTGRHTPSANRNSIPYSQTPYF